MMNVLHIIDSAGLFGAEIMLLNLVEEQLFQGIKSIIASIGSNSSVEKPIESEAIKRGLRVKSFRMIPGPNLAGALKILAFAKKEGIHILHSHGYKGNILFGFLPRALRGKPLISTLHGYTNTDNFSRMRLYEWLDRESLRFIDAVVLVHRGMIKHPKLTNLRGVNFQIVNNGIPLPENYDRFDWQGSEQIDKGAESLDKSISLDKRYLKRKAPNKEVTAPSVSGPACDKAIRLKNKSLDLNIVNFCKGGLVIGSIGRLSKEKCVHLQVDALELLINKGIDARLVIIGDGPLRVFLEKRVHKLGLVQKVLFPGYCENARKYIQLFDVFVISSITEGLPITLLEAMQAKVPIVSTAVGGIPEVLDYGKAGILLSGVTSEAVVNGIERVLNSHNDAEKKVQIAFERAVSLYSSRTMAEGYLEIYKKMLLEIKTLKSMSV
jgi:glycosyltransferase involved in cell wall biosynthesis